jgi:transcriptional regulator with XRE-family HTH domain
MPLTLTETDRLEMERWVAAHRTPQQVAQRCRIVLTAARGMADKAIAGLMHINFKTVAMWRQRFRTQGADSLWEVAQGRGRKPLYSKEKIKAIVDATLQTRPAGATHWSCRTMAKSQGVSKATVNRIWQSHRIKPHLSETFKLSRDAKFLEKLTDVVGLYLCHFVPTRSSWPNLVERWFRELTDKAIRRGVFRSVADLEKAIAEYLDAWNEKPRPFIWTATVGEIVEKLDRARAKLEAIQPGCTQPRHRKSGQKAIG